MTSPSGSIRSREAKRCRYHDAGPISHLCLRIQTYFERHSYATRVKAAALLSVDETMELAGVASVTIAPDLVRKLSEQEEAQTSLGERSLFTGEASAGGKDTERMTFLDDEAGFRKAFAQSEGGRGAVKTEQVNGAMP